MAFTIRNLSVLAYANGFTLWHYKAGQESARAVRSAKLFQRCRGHAGPWRYGYGFGLGWCSRALCQVRRRQRAAACEIGVEESTGAISVACRSRPNAVISKRPSDRRDAMPRFAKRDRQGSSLRPEGRPTSPDKFSRWSAERQHVSKYGWSHIVLHYRGRDGWTRRLLPPASPTGHKPGYVECCVCLDAATARNGPRAGPQARIMGGSVWTCRARPADTRPYDRNGSDGAAIP